MVADSQASRTHLTSRQAETSRKSVDTTGFSRVEFQFQPTQAALTHASQFRIGRRAKLNVTEILVARACQSKLRKIQETLLGRLKLKLHAAKAGGVFRTPRMVGPRV